jgi:hypothetical protein
VQAFHIWIGNPFILYTWIPLDSYLKSLLQRSKIQWGDRRQNPEMKNVKE